MTKILKIAASPRGAESKSNALATAFVEARKKTEPNVKVDVLDLWREGLPDFDGDRVAAKMTFFGVGEMDSPGQTLWDEIQKITQRFIDADHYVLAAPMWNGGVSHRLKQYIDIITQPGLLFGFDPEAGYSGLLKNKRATLCYTSGVWSPGADPKYGPDYHSTYLEWWFDFIGVGEIETIRFQPSLMTGDPDGEFAAAISAAQAAGANT
jgi:FMN-dependent NADH-azoreductase